MGANVRIDAEANLCNLILLLGKLVDYLKFRNAFYIKAENSFLQSEVDFPITLTYASINNLVGRETCVDGCLNLSSAHTVGT